MSRVFTTLSGSLELVGKKEEVMVVFKDLNLPGRNKINKRTGNRYTEFGSTTEGVNKSGGGSFKLIVEFTRDQLVNNTVENFVKHVERSAVRKGLEVKAKVVAETQTEE